MTQARADALAVGLLLLVLILGPLVVAINFGWLA